MGQLKAGPKDTAKLISHKKQQRTVLMGSKDIFDSSMRQLPVSEPLWEATQLSSISKDILRFEAKNSNELEVSPNRKLLALTHKYTRKPNESWEEMSDTG